MTNFLDQAPRHQYVYVWANEGEWRNQSSEAAAIDAAQSDCYRRGAIRVDEIKAIVLEYLDCPTFPWAEHREHYPNVCDHIKVSFY